VLARMTDPRAWPNPRPLDRRRDRSSPHARTGHLPPGVASRPIRILRADPVSPAPPQWHCHQGRGRFERSLPGRYPSGTGLCRDQSGPCVCCHIAEYGDDDRRRTLGGCYEELRKRSWQYLARRLQGRRTAGLARECSSPRPLIRGKRQEGHRFLSLAPGHTICAT